MVLEPVLLTLWLVLSLPKGVTRLTNERVLGVSPRSLSRDHGSGEMRVRDEVLLDIGYKTEGVIPSRELSFKHAVDPAEGGSVGDTVEALVLQQQD